MNVPPSDPISVLRTLPLERWARRLVGGAVALSGRFDEPVEVEVAGRRVQLAEGPAALRLAFEGGDRPHLTDLEVEAQGVSVRGTQALASAAQILLDALHDVSIEITVRTDGEVVLELGNGLQATLADGGSITLKATAEGAPDAPRLVEPLEVDVADHGIRVTHARAPGLSRMARVRVHRFALHPDGHVQLDGGGRGLLDVAVGSGLRRASTRLSDLVRESPRFALLRAFLQHVP